MPEPGASPHLPVDGAPAAARMAGASPYPAVPGVSPRPRVAVLADDLIWATRLERFVREAGGVPVRARTANAFATTVGSPSGGAGDDPAGAIVDLTARSYDAIAAIRDAVAAGVPVIAVGQHDDRRTRDAALAAGASRVLPYARLHLAGTDVVRTWLGDLVRR